ncbi:MAG: 50S ribosomal protein L10 [Candidatus Omnitrophica bacterium]|nr:50S ribosomal protein L10 [Candidatus Omnitrophota bacterium]
MKKLSTIFKETSAGRIKKNIKDSAAFFILRYSKLSGPDLNSLRKALRTISSELFVARNTIARRVLKDSGNENLSALVDGPCGFVFSGKEPVETSKVLYNFSKDHEGMKVEGGLLADRILSKKDFESLAKLPSRQVLLTQTAIALKSPISSLVFVLKGNLRSLVNCLDQIKNKKQ